MPEPIDAYKILQVDPEAEDEVIKAAYRRLARKYHPDLVAGPEASSRMTIINAAWALIGEPLARTAYDRARNGVRGLRAGSARGSAPGTGDRGADRRPVDGEARPTGRSEGQATRERPPETVSRDWTSGRSTQGGGFDESMRAPDGLGAAGPPPGVPSGSVLTFGRFNGWSLGEIARHDIEYIEWLDRMPIGRTYREEIDNILRAAGRRQSAESDSTERRGLFRRR